MDGEQTEPSKLVPGKEMTYDERGAFFDALNKKIGMFGWDSLSDEEKAWYTEMERAYMG